MVGVQCLRSSMIEKYQYMMDDVFAYMFNSIQVTEDDKQIAKEVLEKFPTYVAYFKCDSEMIFEFLYQTVRSMRKTREIILSNNLSTEVK